MYDIYYILYLSTVFSNIELIHNTILRKLDIHFIEIKNFITTNYRWARINHNKNISMQNWIALHLVSVHGFELIQVGSGVFFKSWHHIRKISNFQQCLTENCESWNIEWVNFASF